MGVTVSHGCFDGSYASFGEWRALVAQAAGRPTVNLDRGHRHIVEGEYPSRCYYGWWDEQPKDILDVLLVHADCEGYIFPEHCKRLAKRLEELRDQVPGEGMWWDPQGTLDQFVRGLRKAADEWDVVQFR